MNLINYLETITLNIIILFFPILLYILYLSYSNSFNLKVNKLILSISIFFSLIFLILFNKKLNFYTYFFYTLPLLFTFILKKEKLTFIIFTIILIYFHTFLKIDFNIQLIEFAIIFLIYLLIKKEKNFSIIFSITFFIEKLIFQILLSQSFTLNFNKIIILFIQTTIITLLTLFLHYYFSKYKKVLNLNSVLKQLDKEQKIKASIFKLNHELKNPLAVCNGYLEMYSSASNTKKDSYINIIKEEINRSLTIINDFSSLGKIKSLEKEEMDLALLFEDIKDIFFPLYNEKNGLITIPNIDELYINGDYNRLKQVLVNIIKNSLEAKNKNSIKVNIKVKKYKNNYKIDIIDNGKGMTKQELSHIEDMFYTTKENGSGIGIPYIKEIIELHNGSIKYKSQKNQGTTVTLTLPI